MFVGVVLLSNGLLFALLYLHARDVLMEQLRSKVMSIAATTAALIDGDAHARPQVARGRGDARVRQLEQTLRKVRDANRRDDVHIKFLYTMTKSPAGPER